MRPPVTMLAVPIVSRTKPQKMPACISPARQSLNIFVWTKAYSISPPNRARDVAERRAAEPSRARRREDPQVAGHREDEDRRRAPEDDEDERVRGDVGEDRERHSCSSGSTAACGSPTGSPPPGDGGAGARAAWSNGPASVSSAWSSTGTIASSDSSAAFGLPGRLTISVPPRTPDDGPAQVGHRRLGATVGAHRLGEARDLVVDDGERRLGRHVARRQAGAAGRDDERVRSRRRPRARPRSPAGRRARRRARRANPRPVEALGDAPRRSRPRARRRRSGRSPSARGPPSAGRPSLIPGPPLRCCRSARRTRSPGRGRLGRRAPGSSPRRPGGATRRSCRRSSRSAGRERISTPRSTPLTMS